MRLLARVSSNTPIFSIKDNLSRKRQLRWRKIGWESIMGKIHKQIISLLENSEKPLSLVEIAEQIGKPEKTVFKALRKLFSEGAIDCDNKSHLYCLAKEQS